ncbi:gag-pol polyprotein [Tanacetum coccineum]
MISATFATTTAAHLTTTLVTTSPSHSPPLLITISAHLPSVTYLIHHHHPFRELRLFGWQTIKSVFMVLSQAQGRGVGFTVCTSRVLFGLHGQWWVGGETPFGKWLNKAIDEGPYEFRIFTHSETKAPRLQKEEDLRGDDLKHCEAEIEAMNLILISILNDIYNSVDACKTVKAMWQRVKRLMRGTVQNKVDRETPFNNEFDQFVAEPGEALVSVYNFRLAKRLTEDSYNDLFDYLQQFKKLVNALRAEKVEKSHDPLALVAHTGLSSRTTTPYYVTHPASVVDYDDDYQGDVTQNNSEDPLTSAMNLLDQAITERFSNPTNNQEIIEGNNVQNNVGNIQRTLRTTSSGTAANVQCYNCSEKGHYASNYPKPRVRDLKYFMEQMFLAKQDEAGVILTDEHNDFHFADASQMEEIKELSANICLMARI